MGIWSFLNLIFDIVNDIGKWRSAVCLIAGLVLAGFAVTMITHEPMNWFVAGGIAIGSLIVGRRWERGVS